MRTTRKDRAVAGIINAQSRETLCSRFRKFGSSKTFFILVGCKKTSQLNPINPWPARLWCLR